MALNYDKKKSKLMLFYILRTMSAFANMKLIDGR